MSTRSPATSPPRPARRGLPRCELAPIAAFVALAFGAAWLVTLPLHLGGGLTDPLFTPLVLVMMATPALGAAVLVVTRERPGARLRALGLWPLRPLRRVLGWGALGVAVSMALVLAALPVGALLGVYPADLAGLSGFRETLDAAGAAPPVPVGALVVLQLAMVPLGALVGLLPALGEEIGWRGWLLPRLMPLGPIGAIVVSGVIWGAWHAPVLLLGYNYTGVPGPLAVAAMVGMCTVVGAVFGWLRLRSGSVWPAALAHAAFNATGASYLLFVQAGETVDTTQATILGWTGWILPLLLVAALVATGRFSARRS